MEQAPPENLGSFSNDNIPNLSTHEKKSPSLLIVATSTVNDDPPSTSSGLEEIDRFLQLHEQKTDLPLHAVESLFKSIESMISKYEDNKSTASKFGHNDQLDSSFLTHLNRLSDLIKILGGSEFDDASVSTFNRATKVQHLAMCFLHSELRAILNTSRRNGNPPPTTPHSPPSSSLSRHNQEYSFDHHHISEVEQSSTDEDNFPGYQPEEIYNMSKIATAMISLGYESECCLLYGSVRRTSLNNKLEKLGHVIISAEDINKMDWETLEGEIASMIDIIRCCSSSLFPAERNLCNAIFANHPSICQNIFRDLASRVLDRFFNFAQTISLTKCSAEKLFKFLDLYETLCDLGCKVENLSSTKTTTDVRSEMNETVIQIGQVAVSMFCDLENSIRRDNSRTAVPSGAVHPLTRYTMNYLKYACEYKDTLEQIFLQKQKIEGVNWEQQSVGEKHADGANEDGTPKTSPFSIQLNTVMDLLDENLEMKSNLYRDPSLGHIFQMNNGRYILQKIKSSPEIHNMMGVTWCRRRSSDMRKYHKGYTRETWGRVLQCLRHEGLQVNGKMAKSLLKERFKMFNNTIEEIHKTQSTWVVSDEQLQSELRVSVSAVVIPAYRSFLGRFQQYLANGRQIEKYIKYQPEDIENLIEGLFDGNPTSMARKRT